MKSLFAIIACTIALASYVSAGSFTSCDTSSSALQISTVSVSPDPPVPGKNACVTINGTLSQPITNGSMVNVTVSMFGTQIYQTNANLCTVLSNSSTPCPVPITAKSVTQCVTVPSQVPSGIAFDVKAEGTSSNGTELFCVQGSVTFAATS